jgi:hypothetical protein
MPSDEDAERRHASNPTLARSVIEDRGGYPAHEPKSEEQGDHGLLRVGLVGEDEDLKEISWEEFEFEFEAKELELVYSDDGTVLVDGKSMFLQPRETDDE